MPEKLFGKLDDLHRALFNEMDEDTVRHRVIEVLNMRDSLQPPGEILHDFFLDLDLCVRGVHCLAGDVRRLYKEHHEEFSSHKTTSEAVASMLRRMN